jgi:lipopolysaccharide/colanic/teichoic acid biosynthesis glycosyltransferase
MIARHASQAVLPRVGATAPRRAHLVPRRLGNSSVARRGLAVALLVASSPLLAACAVAVRMGSRGPAFYSQVREGRRGERFEIHKLRTMQVGAETGSGPVWSQPGDRRVTAVGRFLRATHLDELPQLLNVARGHMNFIGPRPERPEIAAALAFEVRGLRARLAVKPGITGLAQILLPADVDVASVRAKLACDMHYIRRRNVWMDLRILCGTALKSVGVPRLAIARTMGFGAVLSSVQSARRPMAAAAKE